MNKNKLTSCGELSFIYELKSLSMAENEITSFEGMSALDKLEKLNVGTNKLESIATLPDLPCLTELVLDGNPIASLKELDHLCKLTCLTSLSMTGCPVAEGDDFKKEVLIALMDHLPNLVKINGEPYTPEDMAEAKEKKEERIRAALNLPPPEEGAAEGEEAEAVEDE